MLTNCAAIRTAPELEAHPLKDLFTNPISWRVRAAVTTCPELSAVRVPQGLAGVGPELPASEAGSIVVGSIEELKAHRLHKERNVWAVMVIEISVREGGGQENRHLGAFSFRFLNRPSEKRADCAPKCAPNICALHE